MELVRSQLHRDDALDVAIALLGRVEVLAPIVLMKQ